MERRVAVVGIGHAGFAPILAGVSYKELMFEAAQRAYADAGVEPRTEVDSFVCCSEGFLEGTSIFDEYVPDQLGAMQRPAHRRRRRAARHRDGADARRFRRR